MALKKCTESQRIHFSFYSLGFLVSFISFCLQLYIPKIAEFYFSESHLVYVFSAILFGFSLGAFSASWTPQRVFPWLAGLVPALPVLFLFFLGFTSNKALFYLVISLIFFPMGSIIVWGISRCSSRKFYFYDLLGASAGVVLGWLSLFAISIEASIATISLLASMVIFVLRKNLKISGYGSFGFALLTSVFFAFQATNDQFNLMSWSKSVSEPSSYNDPRRNGHDAIKNGLGTLVYHRWTPLDRIDIVQYTDGNHVAYSNNASWTTIATPISKNEFPYLKSGDHFKSALSLGAGGGVEMISAEKLGATDIVGVEINSALVSILKGPLSKYNGNLMNKYRLIAVDGHKFLKTNSQKFDLIFNRYADWNSKSYRYFARINLLRTQEVIFEAIKTLTPQGISIWASKSRNDEIGDEPFNIIYAAQRYFQESGKNVDLKKHFMLLELNNSRFHHEKTKPRVFHIIFSKDPFTAHKKDLLFQNCNSCRIWDPAKFEPEGTGRFVELFMNLPDSSDAERLRKFLATNEFHSTLSFERPFHSGKTSIAKVAQNLGIGLVVSVLIWALFVIYQANTTRRHQAKEKAAAVGLSLLLGFNFGLAQVFLIQQLEYFVSTVSAAYGLLLLNFALGSALGTVLSGKVSAKTASLLYLSNLSLLFFHHSYLSQWVTVDSYWLAIVVVFAFVCMATSLFPLVLKASKKLGRNCLSVAFGQNILGLSIGAATYCLVFSIYGRATSSLFAISVTMAISLAVFFIFRLVPPKFIQT